jgi:acetyl-CoA carboxylase biotin carboxylase subunit
VGYFSPGTFEFLLGENGEFYFLEMNTRLQVEHPVTELITGLDLVREMVRVAHGEPSASARRTVVAPRRGHRVPRLRRGPVDGFLPSPGPSTEAARPGGPGVRDDSGAYAGCEISSFYDPLISKLSVWAPDRPRAIAACAAPCASTW